LESDPIGLAGGLNVYAWPGCPLNKSDSLGLGCPTDGDGTAAHQDGDVEAEDLPSTLHTVKPDWVVDILADPNRGINPGEFQEGARFGPALYMVADPNVGAAEIGFHVGSTDGYEVASYDVAPGHAVLDLTNRDANPEYFDLYHNTALPYEDAYAARTTKPADPGAIDRHNQAVYSQSRSLAGMARGDGYTAIRFPSRRDAGGGDAYAIFNHRNRPIGTGYNDTGSLAYSERSAL